MIYKDYSIFLSFLLLLGAACQQPDKAPVTEIRLNHIQVLASHNSYKQAIEAPLFEQLLAEDSSRFLGLEYEHRSLTKQLDLGIRKLELDIVHDPKGGKYAHPLGLAMVTSQGIAPLPYDPEGDMQLPGFKVLHVQDIDFRSNCLLLTSCLQEILDWSDQHPRHLPIAISFNAKDGKIDLPDFEVPLSFTSTAFDSLDQALLSVFPREKILAPDDVRGFYASLEEAILTEGWPPLEQVRGKVLFVLDEQGKKMEAYIDGHRALEGRLMFVNAEPGRPEAGFLIMNNPIKDYQLIQERVQLGYLVRTRADANTIEARQNDYERFEAALQSGAHFITTDYYLPNPKFNTGYQISFSNGKIALCNPFFTDMCELETLTE